MDLLKRAEINDRFNSLCNIDGTVRRFITAANGKNMETWYKALILELAQRLRELEEHEALLLGRLLMGYVERNILSIIDEPYTRYLMYNMYKNGNTVEEIANKYKDATYLSLEDLIKKIAHIVGAKK